MYLARQTGATIFSLSVHCFTWLKSQNYKSPVTYQQNVQYTSDFYKIDDQKMYHSVSAISQKQLDDF